jgi:hypothetical protein
LNKKFNLFAENIQEYKKWLEAFSAVKCLPEKPIITYPPTDLKGDEENVLVKNEKVEESSKKVCEEVKKEVDEPLVEETKVDIIKEQEAHEKSKIRFKHKDKVDNQPLNEDIKTNNVKEALNKELNTHQSSAKMLRDKNQSVVEDKGIELVDSFKEQDKRVKKIVPIVITKKIVTLISPEQVFTVQQAIPIASQDIGELKVSKRSKTPKTAQRICPAKVPMIIKNQM